MDKVDIPTSDYSVGKTTLPPTLVVGYLQAAGFVMDTTQHIDPSVIFSVEIEQSLDDGKTWKRIGGFTRRGGPTPIGRPSSAACHRGFPTKSAPMIRFNVSIEGKSLITSGEAWWA